MDDRGVIIRQGPTILLRSGHLFDLLHPESAVFTLDDIAHALAHICRFTGHARLFYSVAEHCVLMAGLVPLWLKREALFHDAAEAFIGDVSRPLKMLLPDYKAIEGRIDREIRRRLGLPEQPSPEVKAWDARMLAMESRLVMDSRMPWPELPEPAPTSPSFLWPGDARLAFLRAARGVGFGGPANLNHTFHPAEAA